MKRLTYFLTSMIFAILIVSVANAKQVLQLHSGWNLVGITEIAQNMNVSSLINNNIELIVTNENGAWKKYNPNYDDDLLQDFKEFHGGRGYWIKTSNATEITIYGDQKSSTPVMNAGWNLVAFSSSSQVSNLITSLQLDGYKIELMVTNVDDAWQKYNPNYDDDSLQDFTNLDPNLGYWV